MLVCMQKINFITHLFLKILQRNSKLVILGNLSMPGHTPKIIASIWGNIWHLSAGKKSPSSFTFSLSYLFISKTLKTCFGYFGHAWLCTAKVILSVHWKLLCLSAGAKNQLHPSCFSEDWLAAFWPINREPEFCKYGIGGEISTTILAFISDYLQEKLFKFLINFFKNSKKIFWGQFGPFLIKLVKNNFHGKEGSVSF